MPRALPLHTAAAAAVVVAVAVVEILRGTQAEN